MEKTMPASTDLPRIFISYAGDDGLNFARNLHKLLTDEGLPVWWDKTQMEGGKGWRTLKMTTPGEATRSSLAWTRPRQ